MVRDAGKRAASALLECNTLPVLPSMTIAAYFELALAAVVNPAAKDKVRRLIMVFWKILTIKLFTKYLHDITRLLPRKLLKNPHQDETNHFRKGAYDWRER